MNKYLFIKQLVFLLLSFFMIIIFQIIFFKNENNSFIEAIFNNQFMWIFYITLSWIIAERVGRAINKYF